MLSKASEGASCPASRVMPYLLKKSTTAGARISVLAPASGSLLLTLPCYPLHAVYILWNRSDGLEGTLDERSFDESGLFGRVRTSRDDLRLSDE